MTRITVLGGTGYTGGNIAREAVARGHQVTSISRTLPEDQIDGVTYRTGDALDADTLAHVLHLGRRLRDRRRRRDRAPGPPPRPLHGRLLTDLRGGPLGRAEAPR